MCIAQGHNTVPPVRLGPVDSRYHYVTALLNELQSWGDCYQSVHRALNLLSSKPARKILHRYRIFYMRSHLKWD